jgi:hypothetical protein
MKVCKMFKHSVISVIIRGTMIGSGLVVVGSALGPAMATARTLTNDSPRTISNDNPKTITIDNVAAIKHRLINASTKEELRDASEAAKSAGLPWQYIYESAVFYTIRTGDYSMADSIIANLDEFANEFSVDKSLLCGSGRDAAILMHVFLACVALNKGDTETASEHLRSARDLDAATFKALLPRAVSIQKYLNA